MAYDEVLVDRIRHTLGPRPDVTERKMFGGIAFLRDGKMFCGVAGADLMVRVGPERYAASLSEPHARPMDFTGRPLTGYVYVAPAGLRASALGRWLERALDFVATVPAKKPARGRKPRPARRA